jgi:putative ABC transport system permease protein
LRRLTSELNAEFAADKDTPVALTIAYGSGSRNDSSRALALLLALAALLALGVIGIGLTLVAVDSRDEIAVLIAVGASPRTRRGWFGLQAAFLAMLGGLLAVPLGFLPAIAFLSGSDAGYPLLFPLPQAAALVVGVPIVAGLGAYLLSWRSRRWAMPAID